MSERTLVMLKPDTVARGLVGRVIQRIEDRGFRIAGLKILRLTYEQTFELYRIHEKKPFFNDLVSHITSGAVIVIVVEGLNAITAMRQLAGSTNPLEADLGSVRGTFGLNGTINAIHTADGLENAKREIGLFFGLDEIVKY
ncbi:MAG: nucleoside-diphosphate kinase [Thermoproteota archaeon]|nr:nucleoside-diphosphate kinase [Thermoproteota archaeon]